MHIMYQVTFHTTFTQALETAITECEKTSSLFKIHKNFASEFQKFLKTHFAALTNDSIWDCLD